jgi:diguanylate cyclase (GGDEF)-like protein
MSTTPLPGNTGKDPTTPRRLSSDQPEVIETNRRKSLVPVVLRSEYYLDLLIDVLKDMAPPVQGAFLCEFLQHLASVRLTEEESLVHWEQILRRRVQMSQKLERPLSFRTIVLDYLESRQMLKNPIVLPYGEVKRLRRKVPTDPLTGLHNRQSFAAQVEREILRSQRYRHGFALVLMDLRDFQKVNEIYGRAAGDEILRNFANEGFKRFRASDVASRMGGDEFGMLLPQSDRTKAVALGDRLKHQLASLATALVPLAHLGLDCGVAAFPQDGADASSLIEHAQREVEAAKIGAAQGRSSLPLPVPSMEAPALPTSAVPPAELAAAPGSTGGSPVKEEPSPDLPSQESPRSDKPAGLSRQERRYKRVNLSGSQGLGILRHESRMRVVRVLNMSRGGVGLLLDEALDVPRSTPTVLRVPTLSAEEFALQPVYAYQVTGKQHRVGCAFVNPETGPSLLPS